MKAPKIVGILNITPDSFSDGGQHTHPESIILHCNKMISEGVSIIDIGAESTRPEADILSHEQEWKRVQSIIPQIIELSHKNDVKISIDTYHYKTADKALSLGVDIINDISFASDKNMIDVLSSCNCEVILMHSLTIPADKNKVWGDNINAALEIKNIFNNKIKELESYNINPERIIFDPGLGFGKTAKHTIDLLANIDKWKVGKCIIGHSRKSFLKLFSNNYEQERDILTLAFSSIAAMQDIDYIRVHDVATHNQLFSRIS